MKTAAECCLPSDLSHQQIRGCLSLVIDGGAVDPYFPPTEFPKAAIVAIKRHGQNVVAVGTIKRSRPGYATRIIGQSGVKFDKTMHELGYVAVHPSHRNRGLSREIIRALLSSFHDPLFATTSHVGMKRTLQKAGFVRRGKEWPGKKEMLSLWIRE